MDWMHVWCWTRLESPFCISCGFFAANFRMGGSRCGKFIVQIKWEPCPAVVLVNSAIFFKFPFPSFKAEEQTTKTTTKNWIWASLIHVMLCIYVCMCVYSYLCTWQTQIHDLACRSETSARRRRASMQIKNSTHATFEMTIFEMTNENYSTIKISKWMVSSFQKKTEICTQFTLKNWKIMFETIGCRILLHPTFGTSYIPCNGTQFLG